MYVQTNNCNKGVDSWRRMTFKPSYLLPDRLSRNLLALGGLTATPRHEAFPLRLALIEYLPRPRFARVLLICISTCRALQETCIIVYSVPTPDPVRVSSSSSRKLITRAPISRRSVHLSSRGECINATDILHPQRARRTLSSRALMPPTAAASTLRAKPTLNRRPSSCEHHGLVVFCHLHKGAQGRALAVRCHRR